MDQLQALTSYILVGAGVSALVQYLKTKYGTNSGTTIGIVALISIIAGAGFFFAKDTNFWQSFLSVMGFAGAIYTYIIKRFEVSE